MRPVELVEVISSQRLKKARALFLYLACTSNQPHRTDKIIDLLWRDSAEKQANASFRQTVRQIRLTLENAPGIAIETGAGQVTLVWPGTSDFLGDLAHSLSPKEWCSENGNVVRLCLAQMDTLLGLSGSLDSWLVIQRSRFLTDLREALDKTFSSRSARNVAVEAAEFALEIEPSNEQALRFLMQHYWENQAPTRALECYNALYRYLGEEYDHEPDSETQALVAAIKLDPEKKADLTWQQDIRPKLTVSVAPAIDPGASDQDNSLLKVLAADLRRRLSRFREWQILDDRNTASAYLALDLQLLPVAGTQTLHVEVSRPDRGELVWSDVIAAPQVGWDDKVHPVLMNIARALSVEVAGRSDVSPAADTYDYWLRSQALLDAWSPDTEAEALQMLSKVTAEAPKFAPAHAELAGALNVRHILLPGTYQTEDVKQMALHHAIEAVTIDPLDTRAHRVLAWCYCHRGDYELTEFHFEQALNLNQDNTLTMASTALGFAFTHRLDRAAELARRTRDQREGMEPFYKIYLAATDYLCGDFALTERNCSEGRGLMTTVGGWHTASLWKLGQHDAAAERLEAYQQEIAPMWKGDESFGKQSLIDWFVSVFPFRDEAVRDDLRGVLQAVATHAA